MSNTLRDRVQRNYSHKLWFYINTRQELRECEFRALRDCTTCSRRVATMHVIIILVDTYKQLFDIMILGTLIYVCISTVVLFIELKVVWSLSIKLTFFIQNTLLYVNRAI